jgi:four helix bundle protein
MQPFKKLSVWRKSHELTLRVYAATAPFLAERQVALASQLQGGAQSISANIATGSAQASSLEFVEFLQVAIASTRELDYLLLLARDLELLSPGEHAGLEARTDQVLKMLVALQRTVAKDGQTRNRSRMETAKTRGRTNPA